MILIPDFVLTESDKKILSTKVSFLKESMSSFTTEPVKYYTLREKDFEEFLSEKKVQETFSTKAVTIIFTLMKTASSVQEYSSLLASIVSLYQIHKAHSERLLSLLRADVNSKTFIKV